MGLGTLKSAALIALIVSTSSAFNAWAESGSDASISAAVKEARDAASSDEAKSTSFNAMFGDLAKQADLPTVLPVSLPEDNSSAAASPTPVGESAASAQASRTAVLGAPQTTAEAPLPPFTQLPSPTLKDEVGGNQYLRQVSTLIPNVRMTSAHVVRGAQPDGQALALLKQGGVSTIINLRNEDMLVSQEGAVAKRLGLEYVNIPMNIFDQPSKQQINAFLKAVNAAPGKVYVHCLHGQDRTGTMIAIYRMNHDGWDANRAYAEMKSCGFRPYLVHLTAAVYDYSAQMGRPEAVPPANVVLTDVMSHFGLNYP